MSIRIIATGGTFDKQYDELAGKLNFAESHMPDVLERARLTIDVKLEVRNLIDSLDMVDQDRAEILQSCRDSEEKAIVIIHGTDTMRETAQVLGAANMDKVVVLTGAMIPYQIANSDAFFNLGFACGVVQLLPAGVYVAMNGRVFPWDDVKKDKSVGVFINQA